MTVDPTQSPHDLTHTARVKQFLYTGPAAYVSGGDPGLAAALGWGKLFAVLGGTITNGTNILLVFMNPTTFALQLFSPSTGLEEAGAANLSAYTGFLVAYGQ